MLIFLLSFCCWFVLVFLILMNEPDFAEPDAIRVLNGPSLRMLKAQLKQQPTLTSSRERIMSFETHLNITMLQHEYVGGMWKVFRVISYHIFQNTPACYIHFLAFPDYFICSSLLPLFTCFFHYNGRWANPLHLKAVQTHHPTLCTANEFWHEHREAVGAWRKKRSHFSNLNFWKARGFQNSFNFLFFTRTWVFWQLSWVISQNLYDLMRRGKKSPKNPICHIYTTL